MQSGTFFGSMFKVYHDLWGPPDLLHHVERDFSPGVEADLSPPSSAVVMNQHNSTSPPILYHHGLHKDSITFLVLLLFKWK
jgi:hypothetical protein